jgi:hypothetical protein
VNYVLDAGPMIAFLDDEPGAAVVEQVLTEPGSTGYAHLFNLTEIYYIYFRRGEAVMAEDALQPLMGASIVVRDDHDTTFWKEAATFKRSCHWKLNRPPGHSYTATRAAVGGRFIGPVAGLDKSSPYDFGVAGLALHGCSICANFVCFDLERYGITFS